MNTTQVKVGQVWRDNDKRIDKPRELRVESIHFDTVTKRNYAWCVPVMGASGLRKICSTRIVKIRTDRFRPTSTGYLLVEDVA